jgi:hypothetical protein
VSPRKIRDSQLVVAVEVLLKRWVVREGERSLVAEADARGVPGAQGPNCLIFENDVLMRRIWHYPADWNQLEDSRLIALFDRPFVSSGPGRVAACGRPQAGDRDEPRQAAAQR